MNARKLKNSLEIRLTRDKKDYDEILNVRNVVFIREQNVPSQIEFDGLDEESTHVIVKFKDKTIGCARIRSIDGKMKLERIAVLKEYRRRGFGKRLVEYLILYCIQGNAKEIILHAQYYLKNFYEEFGFKPRGEAFAEAGIKHIEMYIKGI